jgi:hypothetical protein
MIAIVAFFALFLVFCSNGDKFSGEKKQQIWIEGIDYEIDDSKLYLWGILQSEIKSCVSSSNLGMCDFNNCWKINGKYFSLKNLGACHLSSYRWIINDEILPSLENSYDAGYGEHLAKLVLIDIFGDSLSYSTYIQVNKPLKVELLSPICDFSDFLDADSIVFQYKISGVDRWEEVQTSVYFSSDSTSLWEEKNILPSNVLKPPFDKLEYFWGVIAYTEQESDTSEIRCIGC